MTTPGDFEPGTHKFAESVGTSNGSKDTQGPRLDPRLTILFAMLYAVQGVVVSYFLTFNGRYMTLESHAGEPLSISQVGWSQTIATLPLALKFLFGLWADRFSFLGFGHRRPYVILGLLMQSGGMVGLTMIDPSADLRTFTITATVAVCGLCFYDVSCDAFAVQVTPPGDRTRVQGILQACRFVSTAVCGVVFGIIWNWSPVPGQGVLWLCGVLALPALVYVATVDEPPHVRSPEGLGLGAFRMFRHRTLLGLLFFSVIYAIVSLGVEGVLVFWFAVPFLAFSERDLGFQSLGRNCGRAVGAVAQGRVAGRYSQRTLVAAGIVGLSLTSFAFSQIGGLSSAMIVGIFFGFTVGWLDALACSMAMDEADPAMPATTFALIMAFQNLGILGTGLMNATADRFGFASAFGIAAAVNLAGIAAWPWIARKPRERDDSVPWSV